MPLQSSETLCGVTRQSTGVALFPRRIGPGYLDWPLEEQAIVFRALAGGHSLPPIEVLDSGAILPEKTLTGLFGLIPLAKE